MSLIVVLFGALFFAAAAYLGIMLGEEFAARITPLDGGPPPHDVPQRWILGVAAAIGAFLFWVHAPVPTESMIGISCVVLAAIFVTDARRGIVPDVFSLGPLAIIFLIAIWQHTWQIFPVVAVPFLPFAVAALRSRGRGMGWGDAKLVALGAGVLGAIAGFAGMQLAIIACMAACIVAVVVNYRKGKKTGVFAFAPYLAAAIALALPVGVLATR